ncbi:MAG: hypothetical protein JTT11_10205 [Candidatus Brockarchaeota archaeon]|nr:hypothetical protein [Candidatus Brockarchaeota archaeon]
MSSKKAINPWFVSSLCLAATLVISLGLVLHYYMAYTTLEQDYAHLLSDLRGLTYSVNLLVEFSNGTKAWYNGTLVPIGWSLFNMTLRTVGEVEYQTMYGSVVVTGIMGERSSGSLFWLWYSWDQSAKDWVLGNVGADQYILREGDTVAWYLADASDFPNVPKP